MSKTKQALAWLEDNPGATPYEAAKTFGLYPSTLYRAIKVRELTKGQRCKCCGALLDAKSL